MVGVSWILFIITVTFILHAQITVSVVDTLQGKVLHAEKIVQSHLSRKLLVSEVLRLDSLVQPQCRAVGQSGTAHNTTY